MALELEKYQAERHYIWGELLLLRSPMVEETFYFFGSISSIEIRLSYLADPYQGVSSAVGEHIITSRWLKR